MVNPAACPVGLTDIDHLIRANNNAGSGDAAALTTPRVLGDGLIRTPTNSTTTGLFDITPAPNSNIVDPLANVLPGSLPGTIKQQSPVTTPTAELRPLLPSMDPIVGARIAPINPSEDDFVPAPISIKGGVAGLRLPSFEMLGIANPHPDRPRTMSIGNLPQADLDSMDELSRTRSLNLGSLPPSQDFDSAARTASLPSDSTLLPRAQRPCQVVEVLTPPEDKTEVLWNSLAPTTEVPEGQRSLSQQGEPRNDVPPADTLTPLSPAPANTAPRIEIHRTQSDSARSSWLGDASNLIMTNLRTAQGLSSPIKVLSHALPSPSPSGFAFPYIISALQNNTPGSPLCWINVFHALPSKFGLNDVPTSPPGTPDPPVGGQDYFTSKTFDSAVRVLDYQENLTTMPRSPHPIVPPSSIGVSIIERYIPPTSVYEFAEMFSVNGRSLLVDRLMELSSDNGTMLFIYPTKAGADTFMRHYLGPIIDPLLRTMRTIHQFPVDMAQTLGRMPAVNSMFDFTTLQARLNELCHELSKPTSKLQRFSSKPSTFSVQMATTHSPVLAREVWAERWWTKQEKTRIRETVTRFARLGNRLSDHSDITPTAMVHAILDGVTSRPYASGNDPAVGVEVGIFVIRRNEGSVI